MYVSKSPYRAFPLQDSKFTEKAYNEIGLDGLDNVMALMKSSEVKHAPNSCTLYSSLIFNYETHRNLSDEDLKSTIIKINKSIQNTKIISNMGSFDYDMLARVFRCHGYLDAIDNYNGIIGIISELNIDNHSDVVYLNNIANLINTIYKYNITVHSDNVKSFVFEDDNIMLEFMNQYDVYRIADFDYSFNSNRTYGKDVFKKMLFI